VAKKYPIDVPSWYGSSRVHTAINLEILDLVPLFLAAAHHSLPQASTGGTTVPLLFVLPFAQVQDSKYFSCLLVDFYLLYRYNLAFYYLKLK
jgi:hypothetical protein